jgi:hypothetical protein
LAAARSPAKDSGSAPSADVRATRHPGATSAGGRHAAEKYLKKFDLLVSQRLQRFLFLDAGERMGSLPTDIGKRVTT